MEQRIATVIDINEFKCSFSHRNSKIPVMSLANVNLAHDQKTHRNDALW